MRTRWSVFLLAACGTNPAFNPPGETAPSTSSGSTEPGGSSSAPTSTGDGHAPGSSTGAGVTSAGVEDTGESTAGSEGSSGEGTSESGEETAGEGSTGGDAARCWDQGPDNWPDAAVVLDGFLDKDPADPELAPDGLSIVYVATMERRPFRSSRAKKDDPFKNGAPIVLWSDQNFFTEYPTFDLDFGELVASSQGDLYVAKFKPGDVNSQYEQPVMLPGTANSGYEESHPNLTQDGTRLLFQRGDGPPLSDELKYSWNFYEARRAAPVSPLDPFVDAVVVTPMVPTLGLALCPVMAPDGLHLLFSSTDAPLLDHDNAADVVSVYYTRRGDLSAPWEPAVKLTTIAPGGGVLCPSSVTADGCTLAFTKFPFSGANQQYTMYLLQRPL